MEDWLQYRLRLTTMTVTSSRCSLKAATASSLPGIFVGSKSLSMRTVERAAAEVAPTELPIFIVGENGTGKGMLATMIHRLSNRCDQDLVKVNCQALPATFAMEQGLGSPLGVTTQQLRGTILLDEVLELPPAFHPHLMALLPEGDLEPHQVRTSPRIIAATRSDDGKPISGSQFSREIYYRLRGVLLRIPPLRERREDIPLLANFLLNKYAGTFGRSAVRLSARAEECFQTHSWPGNVRELENAIKTLLAIDDEKLVLESIGLARQSNAPGAISAIPRNGDSSLGINGNYPGFSSSEPAVFLKEASRIASRTVERQLISEVLERTRWNRKRAAKELNISYKALLYKLKQNGLRRRGSETPLEKEQLSDEN